MILVLTNLQIGSQMAPWSDLNFNGKILAISAILNIIVSIIYAMDGSYVALLPAFAALVSGMATYIPRYQKTYKVKIQNDSKEK